MLSTEGMIYAHNSKRVLGLILDVLVEEYCLRAQVFPKLCNHRTIKKKKKAIQVNEAVYCCTIATIKHFCLMERMCS